MAIAAGNRIQSIDILRGLAMIMMAFGHSIRFFILRNFEPTDLSVTTPLAFFLRWSTHIAAPAFVFLAGISVYIIFTKSGDAKRMSKYLIKRGIWLILLEVSLLTFFWHTHFNVIQLQVLWAIGVSFLLLAFLIYLPWKINLALSILILVSHNILDMVELSALSGIWLVLYTIFLHPGNFDLTSSLKIDFFYTILPYLGMMLLGFSMGKIFGYEYKRRRRILLFSGGFMLLVFIMLRAFNLYGDPYSWSVQAKGPIYTIMSFVNITKYPASLQFVLFTLGTAFILLVYLERDFGPWMQKVRILGQVAMFFYLFHIPFIRIFAKVYHVIFESNPSYPVFFIIYLVIMIALMFISEKYADFKIERKHDKGYWWLRYL